MDRTISTFSRDIAEQYPPSRRLLHSRGALAVHGTNRHAGAWTRRGGCSDRGDRFAAPRDTPALPPPTPGQGRGGQGITSLERDRVHGRLDLLDDHLGQFCALFPVGAVYARGATLSGASCTGETTRAARCNACRP